MNLESSREIFEETQNFKKTFPMKAELFHAHRRVDGQTGLTDTTKLIVAFRNFVNAPERTHFP
jgi:hypothetical protein